MGADPRFDTSKDPRFKAVPRDVRKVKIDKRFSHMFTDKNFVETQRVDARGVKLHKDAGKQKLREFYALDDEGSKGNVTTGKKKKAGQAKKKQESEQKEEHVEEAEADEASEEDVQDEASGGDHFDENTAQGDLDDEEEEEDDDESDDDDDSDDVEDEFAEQARIWEKNEASVLRGDATCRLAVMGCDWDHVTSNDLLVMFKTYLSGKEARKALFGNKGEVAKISVYQSEFGKEQMAKEATEGPCIQEFASASTNPAKKLTTIAEDEAQEKAQQESIRRYQLLRTKFYWALVECDSVATANWLYDQMDGLEAHSMTPASLDLRFVPDELAPPYEPVNSSIEVPSKYVALPTVRSALSHTKVKCTWDEAPQQRKKDLMKKSFSANELADMDLKAYLASSSSEEDEEGAEALRKLVRGGDNEDDSDFFKSDASEGENDDDRFVDMEQSFSTKASEIAENLEKKTTEMANKKVHTLQPDEDKSVWQKYLDKKKNIRKERRKAAKEARKTVNSERFGNNDDDDEDSGDEIITAPTAPKEKKKSKKVKEERPVDPNAATAEDLELLTAGDDSSKGFNMRGPQRQAHKGKKKKPGQEEDSFKVDVDDPRIKSIFDHPDFEIDPTNPEYRRTEGMGAVLETKRKRKAERDNRLAKAVTEVENKVSSPSAPATASASKRAGGSSTGGLQLFAKAGRGAESRGEGLEPAKAPASSAKVAKDGTDSSVNRKRRRQAKA